MTLDKKQPAEGGEHATRRRNGTGRRDPALGEVYEQLRRLAAAYLQRERPDHTLQPTALVHEAYLKLAGNEQKWGDETHFRALAARAMRQILVDHARARRTQKRGGDRQRLTLAGAQVDQLLPCIDLVALEDAMQRLERLDERKCRVVELRFFGGLTNAQAASVLQVSPKTTEADWYFARAFLRRELSEED